ncbi:hypothetical protein [Neisseria musculi]|uniref:hypothetical protein n=1 Tax=Neisseria musculi TaxID=1815583 RepID=UPI00360C6AD6
MNPTYPPLPQTSKIRYVKARPPFFRRPVNFRQAQAAPYDGTFPINSRSNT